MTNEPDASRTRTTLGGLKRRWYLGLARLALSVERVWFALWPAGVLMAVFAAVALADVLPQLPGWLHLLILIGVLGLFLIFLSNGQARWRAVTEQDARHRLERDSGLLHRPLETLQDRPMSGGDGEQAALWRAHQARAAEQVRDLHVHWPRSGVSRLDRWGISAAAFVALVAGFGLASKDPVGPLVRAFQPSLVERILGPLTVEVWLTPPAYTGKAPVFLNGTGEHTKAISVPAGTTLLAQVAGPTQAPDLVHSLDRRRKAESFDALLDGVAAQSGVWRVESELTESGRLSIRSGGDVLASWPLDVVTDQPPEIELMQAPARVGARLRIDFEARDDYGVAEATARITAPDGKPTPAGAPDIQVALPISDLSAPLIQGSGLHDFSSHPWAGLPVDLSLTAKDAAGNEGRSDIMRILLPERIFNHPVARALADGRKTLNAATLDAMLAVAAVLDDVSTRPQHFGDDPIAFLGMRIGQARLLHGNVSHIASVQGLLWDLALRIEDGEVSVAERQLEDAQRALEEAMRRGADPQELEPLMQAYNDALGKYLKELAEMLKKEGTPPESLANVGETIRGDQLAEMLQRARELAAAGRMDEAREVLAEMQRMIDRMRESVEAGRRPNEALQQARQLMDQLREVQDREQKLLDRTFDADRRNTKRDGALSMPGQRKSGERQSQDGSGSENSSDQPGARELGEIRRDQENIRKKLGEAMQTMDQVLGQIPGQMGEAEAAMRDAEQALGVGDTEGAVAAQTRALGQLGEAVQAASERIARSMSGLRMMQPGNEGSGPGNDPFGRGPGSQDGGYGSISGGDVQLKPGSGDLRRAREILEELRRRAGDPARPVIERDYIDRLLRRF